MPVCSLVPQKSTPWVNHALHLDPVKIKSKFSTACRARTSRGCGTATGVQLRAPLSCVWDTCTVSLFPPPPPLVPNPGCPRTGLVPPGTGHWALVLAWTLQPQDPASSSLPSSLLFLLPLLLAHVLQPQFDIQLSIQHEKVESVDGG
jgi:hypothetical protein